MYNIFYADILPLGYVMDTRIIQIRALDKKIADLKPAANIIPRSSSWINTVREAIGMTAVQLANRLGVTQPRVAKMESNEDNLKISTMKKAAEALGCEFVYYFKPKATFQDIVKDQAFKKAAEILRGVNLNMALEKQDISTEEAIEDLANDFINNKTKQIWD